MARSPAVLLLLMSIAVACRPSPGPSDAAMSDADRTALADTVRMLSQGIFDGASGVDLDATFRRFGTGDNAAHLNGGQRYTRDSLASLYRSVFANLQRQEIVPDAPTVTVLGRDAAVYSTRGHFVATPKTGAPLSSDAAWTFVWVRMNGEWTLLHSHQSTPQPLPAPQVAA